MVLFMAALSLSLDILFYFTVIDAERSKGFVLMAR